MGKVGKNSIVHGFRGSIDEGLVIRQIGNKTFFSRRSTVKKPQSDHQKMNRSRFAEAALFAVSELKKPDASLVYELMAEVQGLKTAHHAAVSDFLSNPEIGGIKLKKYKGQVGDVFRICPRLRYKIIAIDVRISRNDGTFVEEGKAVHDGLNWKYTATVENPDALRSVITLTAYDRLGKKETCTFYTDRIDRDY